MQAHSSRVAAMMLVIAGLATPLAAQQYRGEGGTLLDRNLQVGSGGKNVKARDVRDQIWLNNQIITGNAPAGRSFRGYVGYTAPAQFRGATGTDSQFNFVRDSASSAAVSTGVRTSDALRFQMNLTTGQAAPGYLAGAVFTPRASNAATAGAVTTSTEASLRSTADYMTARSLRPTLIARSSEQAERPGTITASNLLGLTFMPDRSTSSEARSDPAGGLGAASSLLTPGTPARPGAEPVTPGAPRPAGDTTLPSRPRGFTPTGIEARAATFRDRPGAATQTVQSTAATDAGRGLDTAVQSSAVQVRSVAHAQMLERLGANAAQAPGAPTAAAPDAPANDRPANLMDVELERIRRVLSGESARPPVRPKSPTEPEVPGSDTPATRAAEPPTPSDADAKTGQRPSADEDADRKPSPFTPEVLKAIKSLGDRKLDTLITPGATAAADPESYRHFMEAGQSLLSKGHYFDAEDRFTRAMAALPGDPLARIARVNAQLGAGLYLSASTNLRRLFQSNPETVGLRFDAKLAPNAERTTIIASQLREEIDQGSTGIGLESSLLLAYLGRATDNPALTREGLTEMSRRLPKNNPADAALYELLRSVWLDEKPPAAPK